MSTRRGTPPRAAAALALRLLALLLAAEVSGAVHIVCDVAAACGATTHADDDCERDGRDCPPGCPGCHCANGTAPWQAPSIPEFVDSLRPRAQTSFGTRHVQVPAEGILETLFRPPKTRSVL